MLLAIVLLAGGPAVAALVSMRSAIIAAVIVAVIVAYDGPFKRTPLAPILLGLCRALNVSLGVSISPLAWDVSAIGPIVLVGLYAASITCFARFEAQAGFRRRLALGTTGVCLATASLSLLPYLLGAANRGLLGVAAVLTAGFAAVGARVVRRPTPTTIQQAVRLFVLGIIVVDGCIAWAAQGPIAGLVVVSLLAPALLLARLFRVT